MQLMLYVAGSVEMVVVEVGVLLVGWGWVVNGFWRVVCCPLAG